MFWWSKEGSSNLQDLNADGFMENQARNSFMDLYFFKTISEKESELVAVKFLDNLNMSELHFRNLL